MRARIEWRSLLSQRGVEFVERGANVSRGELNVRCPFCGSADPSFHLGINQESGWWSCWRNSGHRGKSPVRLLVALLHISVREARDLAGLDEDYVDPDGFSDRVARFMGRVAPAERREALTFPPNFRAFEARRAFCSRHLEYLRGRGFEEPLKLALDYDMRVDVTGPWRDRVVLPYYEAPGELIAWTGRAIGSAEIRYKDLSPDESVVSIKESLYNRDKALQGGNTLAVVEGPVDALKLDWYGRDHGLRAVALSTNSLRESQIYLIAELAQRYKQVVVMMDMASKLGIVDSMKIRGKLSVVPNARIVEVPFGCKDAGELRSDDVWFFASGVTQ